MNEKEKGTDYTNMLDKMKKKFFGSDETRRRMSTRKMTSLALLAALATILMYLEIAIPVVVPSFLKLDLSEIPVLIGAFAFGPGSAIIIELIKNLLHLPVTSSLGVGELANFLAGSIFAGTAGFIYRKYKSKKGAIAGLAAGTIAMTVFTSFLNYYFMLPFYAKLFHMPIDALVAFGTAVNVYVTDLKTMIIFAFVPFNLFKGIIVSLITALVYNRVSPLLHGRKRLHSGQPETTPPVTQD